MGEIFAVEQPVTPMRFTGERMTSDARGQIEYEHLHRYCFARLFCRGKDVVDVAAGEGYGSALLAQVARRVIGVEMAADAIEHATTAYCRSNLRFVRGDARHLPLGDNVADVVVSFETLEHLYEQELFLAEIRRVLRPDGTLVISSPDSQIYSTGSYVNPFHVRELTCAEFKEALLDIFPYAHFYSQRALIGSAMTVDGANHGVVTFERRSEDYVDAARGLPRAPYIVAVASASKLDQPCQTLYIDLTRTAHLLTSQFGGEQPLLPHEAAALRAALGEHEAALAAARVEIEQQVRTIADIERQRRDAADAAQRTIAELGSAVSLAEQQAREHAVALDAASARLAELEVVQHQRDELHRALLDGHMGGLDASRHEIAELREAADESKRKGAEQERVVQQLRTALAEQQRIAALGWAWRFVDRRRRRQAGAAIKAGLQATQSADWGRAANCFRQALACSPAMAPIWIQLGHALKEQGDFAGAEAAYVRALALDEAAADTHLQLGHLFKLQARWDDAADAYVRALQLNPDVPDAAAELDVLCHRFIDEADAARDARNWPAAARHYRRALSRQPELMPIWVQLGHALKEQQAYVEAEAAYRRALVIDDTVADTHLQLGHLLKMQGRRPQAIEAYAIAVRLDPDLLAAREALHALLGYSPSETARAIVVPNAASRNTSPGAEAAKPTLPTTLADRYGALFAEAAARTGRSRDVIWLGVIDWHFRIQRPQHLATNLADAGARVFYVSLVFEPADEKGRFRLIEAPHPGVYEVRTRLAGGATESIYQGISDAAVGELHLALDELIAALGLQSPIVMVEHPAWYKVAAGVPGATVVYDCLDLATGFANIANTLAASENAMLATADVVITASRPLAEHIAGQRSSVLVRNAADVEFFAHGFADGAAGERPVIGYFGAIAEWFDIEWIERGAAARPQWDFRLIGRTDGCDISRAGKLPNVRFFGERPYQELPELLRDFDVAIIPFKLVELTRCTNPVKLYEYMAAGKAVVAAPMPEVIEATDLVYIADDAASFIDRIETALRDDSPALRARRQAWAREHTWANRAHQLAEAIDASFPLVSVVVLAYNNWEYTSACLSSLRRDSDYPNIEIIVVDNASTDGTPDRLAVIERQDPRVRMIRSEENLGFPGGNNIGLRAATGDYVIMLNNDTYVTRGWVRDLIRPMQLDPRVGMVGPLTNNIGNEQKIRLPYRTMPEMQEAARRFVRARLRQVFEVDNLAFFCVAMRRSLLDEVGLLDEAYGLGYYEDDDYCRRARQANWKLAIADDVFVHHHLGVSYDKLGSGASELMARNRAIFEQRWGPWQPHRYRDAPGFG